MKQASSLVQPLVINVGMLFFGPTIGGLKTIALPSSSLSRYVFLDVGFSATYHIEDFLKEHV
jgi:hypothetical protein